MKRSQNRTQHCISLTLDEVDMLDQSMTEYFGSLGTEHQHLRLSAESLSERINALREPLLMPDT